MFRLTPVEGEQELEGYIRRMLAENRGCDADQLAANFKLKADLGMDGDAAVEFFRRFGEEFKVDLTSLKSSWSFYFEPEGFQLTLGMKLALAVAASAVVLEMFLFPHISGIAEFVTVFGMFLLMLLAVKVAERMNGEDEKPEQQEITVGELFEAARSGRWKVPEEIEAWLSKQKSFHPST